MHAWHSERTGPCLSPGASSCTEAGLLSTLAMLRGPQAKAFLEEQGVRFWLLP
jgi:thiamine biosynthesis lipoprotein